jgi:hypothetical protein
MVVGRREAMVLIPCAGPSIYQIILLNGQTVGGPADDIRSAHSENANSSITYVVNFAVPDVASVPA